MDPSVAASSSRVCLAVAELERIHAACTSPAANQINLIAPLSPATGLGARDEGQPILGPNVGEVRFNMPTGIARSRNWSFIEIPRQALFIADTGNHVIRKVRYVYGAEGCPLPWA